MENQQTVEETLQQRGSVYGDYSTVVRDRSVIMDVLVNRYEELNGEMTRELEIMFNDLVLKLVRFASRPTYLDSIHDLQGYAKLIEQSIKGEENEVHHKTTKE
jgi:hypothetical protein